VHVLIVVHDPPQRRVHRRRDEAPGGTEEDRWRGSGIACPPAETASEARLSPRGFDWPGVVELSERLEVAARSPKGLGRQTHRRGMSSRQIVRGLDEEKVGLPHPEDVVAVRCTGYQSDGMDAIRSLQNPSDCDPHILHMDQGKPIRPFN